MGAPLTESCAAKCMAFASDGQFPDEMKAANGVWHRALSREPHDHRLASEEGFAVDERPDKECHEMHRDMGAPLTESCAAECMAFASHGKLSDEMMVNRTQPSQRGLR
eukprot:1366310-Karenia_brevis.AAC.1